MNFIREQNERLVDASYDYSMSEDQGIIFNYDDNGKLKSAISTNLDSYIKKDHRDNSWIKQVTGLNAKEKRKKEVALATWKLNQLNKIDRIKSLRVPVDSDEKVEEVGLDSVYDDKITLKELEIKIKIANENIKIYTNDIKNIEDELKKAEEKNANDLLHVLAKINALSIYDDTKEMGANEVRIENIRTEAEGIVRKKQILQKKTNELKKENHRLESMEGKKASLEKEEEKKIEIQQMEKEKKEKEEKDKKEKEEKDKKEKEMNNVIIVGAVSVCACCGCSAAYCLCKKCKKNKYAEVENGGGPVDNVQNEFQEAEGMVRDVQNHVIAENENRVNGLNLEDIQEAVELGDEGWDI